MKKVFKYELNALRVQHRPLPAGAEILTVGQMGGSIFVWALVDPHAQGYDDHVLEVYGTGHEIEKPEGLRYIGTTFDTNGSPLVFHIFERMSPAGV